MVEEMAALGEAPKVIARALSITYTQLQREYRDQLLRGSARLRAELIGLVWAKARAGNWQAIQWLLARMTAIEAEKRLAAEPKPAKLGKKERAHREAQTAGDGTEWGEDLAPAGGYPTDADSLECAFFTRHGAGPCH
ncbi:hypothetical protein M446_3870 [Methylobacterium sp. 4-46]|uniref:hypothetical protein n=1 Tax=unclassified Methylobacterium TaxID=2615210 RepID=UPI000165CAC9|nr:MULTISPECIES: hypothetical protein [Methylobacterium]ACA18243.1 hypothetical protein M446_3870 [Methylobacterium sp. 4-46]WFT77539.1 hypothetical protein QA634_19640 [Methylobacterium nodulans]